LNKPPAQIKAWAIFADLKNVDFICSEISAWLAEKKLSEHLFPLEMLAREALNNAIIHGCQMDESKNIYAEFQCDENALRLKVADDGSGFDWRSFLQSNTVNDEKENGRGLKIYQLYADQIEFNECGNQVTLTRLLKKE
jgi:serine/threonine-protein kinase RsbW